MKKNKIAFTMIELIVVISIISIISITSINWFFNFLEDRQVKMKIWEIPIFIENLDKKIKNFEIYDYTIEFRSNLKDSYITKENIFDSKKYVNIDYDYLNASGNITLSNLSWEAWYLSIFKDKKLIYNNALLVTNFEKNDFEKSYNYTILSTLSWATNIEKLNSIEISRIDKEENLIELEKITSVLWWTDIWNIELRNIWWKKHFYNSWAILNINEFYLYFESKWKENYIKITK